MLGTHPAALIALPQWAQICAHFFNKLHASLITFPNFVRSQCLMHRNVAELSSSNCGISHLNEACRIDDDELSRGSVLGLNSHKQLAIEMYPSC